MIFPIKAYIKMFAAMAGILIIGVIFCGGVAALTIKIFGVHSLVFKAVGATLIIPALLTFWE